MDKLRNTNSHLDGVVPYDPKYLPSEVMLSANENPDGLPQEVARAVADALTKLPVNRYPDPLANELRDQIASAYGLSRDQVLVGNGGDELLFD
ncbi:MAG: histidinol-phosphate transaminase, partial [Eggerthellaceae bacterium]|nr:histidinol-phosphate transaminase [Eggerthellaceae bacterium]